VTSAPAGVTMDGFESSSTSSFFFGNTGHVLDQGRQRPSVVTLHGPTMTTDP
jgi:hypothetical protein